VEAGSPWIHHNVVWESFDRDLDDPGDPHGIQVVTGTATIEHNLVGRGDSNGLLTANTSDPVVRNNIFLENGIPGVRGRGICAFGGPNGVIEHNLFQGNALAALLINVSGSTQNHTAEEANDGSPGDNVYGNRDGDPLLADPDALDWALTIMSPAIDAGLPASSPDPDGTIADIGPFFFDQSVTGTEPPPRHLGLLAVPNPFVAATSLRFVLNESSPVRLEVFDVRGRLVSRVAAGVFPAGEHRITWDGRSVLGVVAGPGVYLVRLTTGLRPSVFRIVRTP
jgi:hypothetical protein